MKQTSYNRGLIGGYLFIFVISLTFILLVNKRDIHLFINRLNNPFFDLFFKYVTSFGEFLLIGPILLLLFFKQIRLGLAGVLSSLLAFLLTHVGKWLIWPDSPRPAAVFKSYESLHVVDGVHLYMGHSFPSGHTSGAFALFILLALAAQKPLWKSIYLLMACLVAYSRMYLSQHFLIDVTIGSLIGAGSAMLCYYWLQNTSFGKKPWMSERLSLPLNWFRKQPD
jgi:membrane-associated phospholipid phosphatase